MKWKKYTIDTTTEAVDFISEELNEIGIQGIEIEDHVTWGRTTAPRGSAFIWTILMTSERR